MNRADSFIIVYAIAAVVAAATLPCSVSGAQHPTSIADKIEPITPQVSAQQQLQLQPDSFPNRSPFLESLFNIPIQTLRAVNDLVQGIAGSVQSAIATQQRYPPRMKPQRKELE